MGPYRTPLGPVGAIGPMGPVRPWAHGTMGPRAHGPTGPWAHRLMGPRAHGALGPKYFPYFATMSRFATTSKFLPQCRSFCPNVEVFASINSVLAELVQFSPRGPRDLGLGSETINFESETTILEQNSAPERSRWVLESKSFTK